MLLLEDVAAQLRVSPRTVRRLVQMKEIECFHIGSGRGSLRFRPWAAEDYVKRQEVKTRRKFEVIGGPVR